MNCYTVTRLHGYTVSRCIVTSLHRYTVSRYIVTSLHRYIVASLRRKPLHRYTVTPLRRYTGVHPTVRKSRMADNRERRPKKVLRGQKKRDGFRFAF